MSGVLFSECIANPALAAREFTALQQEAARRYLHEPRPGPPVVTAVSRIRGDHSEESELARAFFYNPGIVMLG